MAAYSRAKLAAVNEVLEAISEDRIAALDSTGSWPTLTYGSTAAGAAEFILDRAIEFELLRGWRFNTALAKKYVVTTVLTFGSSVIRVVPVGPSARKVIDLRSGAGYDLELDSATLTAGDYFFDVVTIHEFSTIPLDIQNLIVKRAKRDFHRERKGNPIKDALLLDEYRQAESICQRPVLPLYNPMVNQQPLPTAGVGSGGSQQQ